MKIPTDKDGKPKQFAFVNFKHEVSVPYAMNLLNGIKLFGRPIKIQFRSGNYLMIFGLQFHFGLVKKHRLELLKRLEFGKE